ncbi:MAG: Ppx/GppA phosphatase family protein [Bdellovibrionota bacterium]
MRIAIIDLGTNSVRFDVHQIDGAKKLRLIHREKLMIRLGQDLFLTGKLNKGAVTRTLHAFDRFKEAAQYMRARKIVAFATSALREASDRNSLLEKIKKRTGIRIRVISGRAEADLIAVGVLNNERKLPRRFALVDIGGGSTEISVCSPKKILFSHSFELGTARLQQLFLKRIPPSSKGVDSLRKFIRKTLEEQFKKHHLSNVPLILGSSGTIRALEKIVRKGYNQEFTKGNLSQLVSDMCKMTTTELLGLPEIEARRVDMILSGAILLEECMRSLGAKQIRPTNYSLRDGILHEELKLLGKNASSHIGLHFPEVRKKAIAFGAHSKHIDLLIDLSSNLFDGLRNLHHLKPQWKAYLQAATVLIESGKRISHFNSELHSYYIVKNADLPSLEDWESDVIAKLCLFSSSQKVEKKDLDFDSDLVGKNVFLKLLAMIRILYALDSASYRSSKFKRVQIQRGKVKIRLDSKSTSGLESVYIDRSKKLFEDLFGRALEMSI